MGLLLGGATRTIGWVRQASWAKTSLRQAKTRSCSHRSCKPGRQAAESYAIREGVAKTEKRHSVKLSHCIVKVNWIANMDILTRRFCLKTDSANALKSWTKLISLKANLALSHSQSRHSFCVVVIVAAADQRRQIRKIKILHVKLVPPGKESDKWLPRSLTCLTQVQKITWIGDWDQQAALYVGVFRQSTAALQGKSSDASACRVLF